MAVRESSELEPGDEVEGECGDVCPGLVRGEVEGAGEPRPELFGVVLQ
jgi:hypothetical protein